MQRFSESVAEKCGLIEAIVLNIIAENIDKRIGTEYKANRVWYKTTYLSLLRIMPYVSVNTIKRAVKHLESEGYIIIEHFEYFSRINFYGLTEKTHGLIEYESIVIR